jgi:hypothetical protein
MINKNFVDFQSSYQIRTFASNGEKEIHCLKAQVDLFWENERKRYVEFGCRITLSVPLGRA